MPSSTIPTPFPLPFVPSEGGWISTSIKAGPPDHTLALGAFKPTSWLTADFYNPHQVILQIKLSFVAKTTGRVGEIIFALYPQIRARLRIPGTALALNSWLLAREGALLKPMCGGEIVSPEEVATLRVTLLAGPEGEVHWWQSPWTITDQEPAKLERAESLHPFVLDELGQRATRDWPDKTTSVTGMVDRLRAEASGPASAFPETWTRWGGSALHRHKATGYFRTHHDGRRWWLVDPDGGSFWSTGLCCVAPGAEASIDGLEHLLAWLPDQSDGWADAHKFRQGPLGGKEVDYLIANLIRAFGPEEWREKWYRLAANFMRRRRFNTVGNWSNRQIGPKSQLPHTRPLFDIDKLPIPLLFRDLPDVFHPDFESAASAWAEQLRVNRDDPAFIGYFICNEPNWSFSQQTPAEGMLANTETAFSREKLADWLRHRHGTDATLAAAWGQEDSTFDHVARGKWERLPDTDAFRKDAGDFSAILAARLFDTLGEACRRVVPHHLNLGARFAHIPPEWMMSALGSFDVFSFNSYSKKPREAAAAISAWLNRPILIGEWHFGAADTGMPAAGLESVATQEDRALAYRTYLEAHAAAPWCVGVHWFTLYDQSALGRYDGEPYNCGFLDVCHKEQTVIAEAAQKSHEIVYALAAEERSVTHLPAAVYSRRLSL